MSINLSALMKQRYDTAANWTAQNPTLLAGEIGIESDTKKWKVGTGATAWTSLTYAIGGTYPIVNADIAAGAEIAVSKLADGSARQLLQTDAAGTGVEWTSDVSIPGVLAVTAGSAALPGIAVSGDTNTGIYSPGADQLAIATGGNPRLFVSSAGNVGIGTSSPSSVLDVASSNSGITLTNTGASNKQWRLGGSSAGSFVITETGISDRLTIDSSGRLGIGTTSPDTTLTVGGTNAAIRVQPSNAANAQIFLRHGSLGSNSGLEADIGGSLGLYASGSERARIDSSGRLLVGTTANIRGSKLQVLSTGNDHQSLVGGNQIAQFELCRSSDSAGGAGLVADGNVIARIECLGNDGSAYRAAARIEAVVDGTPGASDMPGRLVFSTTADGAASPTEALRITNDRVLAYNQPTPATYAAAATLTVADLKTKIITYTGTAATLTLPTGTLTEGGFAGIYTNMTFEWSVINTGAGICTIGAGTAHTIVGSATVAIGASARFASRRTAANTFVSYRLS